MATERNPSADSSQHKWDQEDEQAKIAFKPLTREQAQALRESQPTVSPWHVVAAQAALGGVVALLAMLITGSESLAWSALWGAATAVVPGALMARGMTSRLTSLSPMVSAIGVMVWELVKVGASVAMLVLAPKVVMPLSWPMLLATLAACLSVYWFALLWRGRKS
jgi:ATP synthase protein I